MLEMTKKQFAAIALATVIEMFCVTEALITLRQTENYRTLTRRNRSTILATEAVLGDLRDTQTAHHGFLLTDQPYYLDPYTKGTQRLPSSLASLKTLAAPDRIQVERVARIEALSREKIRISQSSITAFQKGQAAEALRSIRLGKNKQIMEEIRQLAAQIQREEEKKYQVNLARFNTTLLRLHLLLFSAAGAFILLLIAVFFTLRHQSRLAWEQVAQQTRLNETRATITAQLAHDLTNNFTTIISSLEIILPLVGTLPAKVNRHIGRIQFAVSNAYSLLEDMLLVGKAEAQTLEAARRLVDLLVLVQSCIDSLGGTSLRHSLSLRVAGTSHLVAIDDYLVRRAINNLLSNALKYSPSGGEITVEVCFSEQSVAIAVADQGIGIPPDDLSELFIAYHRATNTSGIKGTGLGLALVAAVAQAHNGSVEVFSALGEGSTFILSLSLAAAH
jgi:signal transduction histidine kinase